MPGPFGSGTDAEMINSIVHHLGIGLLDPSAAEPFFDALFVEFLRLEKLITGEAVAGWKGRGTRFYLYPLGSGAAPGSLQHLAFTARSREEVDAFPAWAALHGVRVTDGPRPYPRYERDYYAVFFDGPEGSRFELVHLSEADAADPL